MLAECELRAGHKKEAAELINQVRARSFENRNDPDPVTVDNLDEYRMLDEWMIEFLGEGPPHRSDPLGCIHLRIVVGSHPLERPEHEPLPDSQLGHIGQQPDQAESGVRRCSRGVERRFFPGCPRVSGEKSGFCINQTKKPNNDQTPVQIPADSPARRRFTACSGGRRRPNTRRPLRKGRHHPRTRHEPRGPRYRRQESDRRRGRERRVHRNGHRCAGGLPDAREEEHSVRVRLGARRLRDPGGERHAEDL